MSRLQEAERLLELGIQTVPLDGKKRPTVAYKDIEVTKQFIEDNKKAYSQTTSLGALCRGIWCIDIDVNHTEGVNGFESLEYLPFDEELKQNMAQTMVQRTPSGGKHVIFVKRDGIDYKQKINYVPGVDIKANYNNTFTVAGSVTTKGVYKLDEFKSDKSKSDITPYEGDFEQRIFSGRGNYSQQVTDKYSMANVLDDYDFSHLSSNKKGEGLGKKAYDRIVDGNSGDRNNDLFLAVSYAVQCNISVEPLKVLIGDDKGGDIFTQSEWKATEKSARNSNVVSDRYLRNTDDDFDSLMASYGMNR